MPTPTLNRRRPRLSRFVRPSAAPIVLAAGVLVLSACGSKPEAVASSTTEAPKAPCAVPAGTASPKDGVRIAYPSAINTMTSLKGSAMLDAAIGTAVTWTPADGPSAIAAVNGGSADIALVDSMSYAPSISDAVTTAPRVVWVADIIGSDEAMVGRGFTSILETQDVKIAAPKTTTAGYSMQAALISATLNPAIADWLDAPNASLLDLWNAGEIDAAYASGDVLTALLNAGATPLITSAELAGKARATFHFVVVSRPFIDANPAVVAAVVCAMNVQSQTVASSPQTVAGWIASETGVDAAAVQTRLAGFSFPDAAAQATPDYLNGGLVANLRSHVDVANAMNMSTGEPSNVDLGTAIYPDAANALVAGG